jgi:2-polyprenyl-3-methyl-5-hydroxy-6-metoxy-1,4-benzoquinol methylase
MKIGKYQVVQDADYGYRRLDPLPDDAELTRFYESQYYDLIRKGGRAPELRRLMAGGKEGGLERRWLHETLYTDILYVLDKFVPGKRVLDVGCGVGEFLSFLKQKKRNAAGVEPAQEAAAAAQKKGLDVRAATLEEFAGGVSGKSGKFGAVVLLNVLEHTPRPENVVELVKKVLEPKGVICVRVPNDFSEIQLAAYDKLKKDPWWISPPDHINYFNFKSLQDFLEKLGFKIVYAQGDYPMELFLLQGDDYTGNPELGGKCHRKRVDFELSIPGELRRRMYQALALAGMGRDCLTFGRLKGK